MIYGALQLGCSGSWESSCRHWQQQTGSNRAAYWNMLLGTGIPILLWLVTGDPVLSWLSVRSPGRA